MSLSGRTLLRGVTESLSAPAGKLSERIRWPWKSGLPRIRNRMAVTLPASLAVVGVVTLIASFFPDFSRRHESLPYLIAVVLSALMGGRRAAALAVVASMLALELVLPTRHNRPFSASIVNATVLCGIGVLTVILNRRHVEASSEIAKVRAELESRVERRTEELAGAVARLRREIQARQRTQDELRSVTAQARCILWRAELEGGKDWEPEPGGGNRCLSWKVWVQDVQAAQSVLPLDLLEGNSYYKAWVLSRHPEDALAVGRICREAVLGGRSSYSHEYRCYDKYGHERWLSEEVQIQLISPGRWGLFGVTIDATARKRASERLRASEERFSLFMEHLPGVAFIKDHKDRYVFMNRSCERLFRLATGGGPAAPEQGGHAPDDSPKDLFPQRDADVMAAKHHVQSVEVVTQPHATQFFLMHKFEIPARDGKSRLLGGVAIDMTEQKRVEEEILEHRRKLRALAAEVSRTEERERRQIAAALHDQIGSLLAVAQMQLESVRMADGDDRVTDANRALLDDVVDSIEKAISHSRSLTCELSPPLLYEAGLEAAVNWLGDQIHRRHGLPVQVESYGEVQALDLERKVLFFQGVRELLTNTVKHARAKLARVELRVGETDVRVIVSDDGVGIGQSEATRPNGFGLFHLRERLEYLGGKMEVASTPGLGTRTCLSVPWEQQRQG
jgi:signal transduction histidine kinase